MIHRLRKLFSHLRIKTKLAVLIGLLIGAISTCIYIYFPYLYEKEGLEALSRKGAGIATMIAFSLGPSMEFRDVQTMDEILEAAHQNRDVVYVAVKDVSGNIVRASNIEAAFLLQADQGESTQTSVREDGNILQAVAPIQGRGAVVGSVFLGLSLAELKKETEEARSTIMLVSLAIFVVGILAVIGISTVITEPLRLMVSTVKEIGTGNLSKRTPIRSNDEVGILAKSFNGMLENLEKAYGDLESANKNLETRVEERTRTVLEEVAERKRAEEALKETQRMLTMLVNNLPGIVYRCANDKHWTMEYISEGCKNLTGYASEELVGNRVIPYGELIHPDCRNDSKIQEAIRTRRNFVTEYRIVTKEGEEKWVWEKGIGVFDAKGKLLALEGFITDITAQKRIEQEREALQGQLLQSQKFESLGTLAGGIAHDFNNILTIILGYASMLGGDESPVSGEAARQAILNSGQRGADLVRQILTFARKTEVKFETVNLNELVADIGKMLKETFPRSISFEMNLEGTPVWIDGDRTQIHQSLLNLCVNARDAMPEGGTITYTTEFVSDRHVRIKFPDAEQRGYVRVTIRDTGEGMSNMTVARIFEPFFTTKEQGKGTGLGLAVVYGIMQNHHGYIDVESAPGKGTAFHLIFPTSLNAAEAHATGMHRLTRKGRGETILVVEDETMLRDLVSSVLMARGYDVLATGDGHKALELFRTHVSHISLVLTDIGLPGISGQEIISKVKETNPSMKVVVASGYLDPLVRDELTRLGTIAFVQKPYLPDDILEVVQGVMSRN